MRIMDNMWPTNSCQKKLDAKHTMVIAILLPKVVLTTTIASRIRK